jgi:hypothetical protein
MEAGTFPTSYIGTTTVAVARAQDVPIIPPANMSWFTPPGGSWMSEFIQLNPGTNNRIVANGTPSFAQTLGGNGTNQLTQYDDAAPLSTANSMTMNVPQKGASSYTPTTGRICLNGGAVASGAMPNGYPTFSTGGIRLFSDYLGGNPTTGYIRRLSYWPRVLSDVEMQQVTT